MRCLGKVVKANTNEIIQPYVPELKKKCNLSNDIYDYHFVSQGKTKVTLNCTKQISHMIHICFQRCLIDKSFFIVLKVTSIDDNEDLEFTHEAFKVYLSLYICYWYFSPF